MQEYLEKIKLEQIKENIDLESDKRILFVLLSWLFEKRFEYQNVADIIMKIYSDFNYPQSMNKIVNSILPADFKEEWIGNMFNEWSIFLEVNKKGYEN